MLTAEDLLDDSDSEQEAYEKPKHLCRPFALRAGHFKNITRTISVQCVPAKDENLKGREYEMFLLTKDMMESKNRLISLLGWPGIGKTSLARNALHFLTDRNYFTSGVVLIPSAGDSTVDILEQQIIRILIEKKQLKESDFKSIPQGGLVELII